MKILSNSPGVLWDCHMHSEFSADSGTPTADMIRQAIALGFKGICFTEHLDPDYPPTPDDLEFALDIPAYYTKLNELKRLTRIRFTSISVLRSVCSFILNNIFTIF